MRYVGFTITLIAWPAFQSPLVSTATVALASSCEYYSQRPNCPQALSWKYYQYVKLWMTQEANHTNGKNIEKRRFYFGSNGTSTWHWFLPDATRSYLVQELQISFFSFSFPFFFFFFSYPFHNFDIFSPSFKK
jgi:hypothetical protein